MRGMASPPREASRAFIMHMTVEDWAVVLESRARALLQSVRQGETAVVQVFLSEQVSEALTELESTLEENTGVRGG